MSNEVWAITSGAYSDWNVHCVCDDKEEAEKAAAKLNEGEVDNGRDFQVLPMPYVAGEVPVHTTWRAYGELEREEIEARAGHHLNLGPERPFVSCAFAEGIVQADCVDREAAIKAVKDRLAAMRAERKFAPGDRVEITLPPMGLKSDEGTIVKMSVIARAEDPKWLVELGQGGGRLVFEERHLRARKEQP